MAIRDQWTKAERDENGNRTGRRVPTALHGKGKRYRVRYHDYDESFNTKAAAEHAHYKIRSEAPKKATDVQVGELVDRWLAGKQGLSKSRIQGCNAAAGRVKERWGNVPAADATEQDVREWQAGLRIGASSIRKAMECLSGAMRLAVKMGAIEENPCLEVRRPAEHRKDPRFLSPTEIQLLADEAGRFRPMVLLMGTSGLRIGEACNLRVGDVDRRRRRIWVASKTAKSRKGREVPVRSSVLAELPVKGRPRSEWLFTSPDGGRVDEHNWRSRHFAPAAERAGLSDITPHTLRHTAASLAVASGADVMAVQRMLGHASAKMTLDTYTGLWDQGLDQIMDRMDGLFGDDAE